MSTEALLTLVSLLVAGYQFLPTERRLSLRIRVGLLDIALAVVALLLVHYIKFVDVLQAIGIRPLGVWLFGLNADSGSYLVLLGASLLLGLRIATARLSPRRVPVFQELAEASLFNRRFPDLLALFRSYLPDLRLILEQGSIVARLHRYVAPRVLVQIGRATVSLDGRSVNDPWAVRFMPVSARSWLAAATSRKGAQRHVERLFDRVFLSVPFTEFLATAEPYFALKVLDVAFPTRAEFLRLYLDAMLKNPHSALYDEIRNNQLSDGIGRNKIDVLNPLINFFVGPEFRAPKLALYKPVGDLISDRLRALHTVPQEDRYRQPLGSYYDNDRHSCPVFAGRCLFTFMVTEGLHRGIEHHLWVQYIYYWITQIVQNLEAPLNPEMDLDREWPTPYHYLLYELFSTMTEWAATAAAIDENLKSVRLESGSITMATYDAIASSLRVVLAPPYIHAGFKGYLLGEVANGYSRIREAKRPHMAEAYLKAIAAGGGGFGNRTAFRQGLSTALANIDATTRFLASAADLYVALERVSRTAGEGEE